MRRLIPTAFRHLAGFAPAGLLIAVCAVADASAKDKPVTFGGSTPLQWSGRMADSEMARLGDKLAWSEGGKARWDYTAGLFTLSLLKLNEAKPDARYVNFATNAIGSFITDDGDIHGYKAEEYQLDALNPGKTVLALWALTQDDRYQKCAMLLRKQLDTQPRTSHGGFWHKQRYTNQMWLDGLYMAAPFYAEYTRDFDEPVTDYNDVAQQFKLVDLHLYDPRSELYYHGWDESKQQPWANPSSGASSNFWGRADGWYAMALVDVLDYLPEDHAARPAILLQIKKLAAGIVKHQDGKSGLWWQVMDKGNQKGNYLEATASAMFVYALAKAVNQNYVPRHKYESAIRDGFQGLVEKLVQTDDTGAVSLTQCCAVAGLGNMGKARDGSFNYYVGEPIVTNDLKGVGPFILAGIEVQKMLDRK